jgi:hypothetical protein
MGFCIVMLFLGRQTGYLVLFFSNKTKQNKTKQFCLHEPLYSSVQGYLRDRMTTILLLSLEAFTSKNNGFVEGQGCTSMT